MKNEETKYYVYKHIRLDTNDVFYIGKGSNKRAFNKSNRNIYWKRIVKKTEYKVEFISENLNSKEACLLEIQEIAKYRKLFTLCNFTDGGEGALGTSYPCSEEKKKKLSEINKNMSEETKLKMSLAKKGKPSSRKGQKCSDETRKKLSLAQKGKPSKRKGTTCSEESKKKMSLSQSKRPPRSLETRRKLSESAKKQWERQKCQKF